MTPELWDAAKAPAGLAREQDVATAGGHGYHGAMGNLPPTPQLLAQVDALPPAGTSRTSTGNTPAPETGTSP